MLGLFTLAPHPLGHVRCLFMCDMNYVEYAECK